MTVEAHSPPAGRSKLAGAANLQRRALGYDRRSQLVPAVVAVGLPAAAAILCWDKIGYASLVLAVLVPGPLILALAEIRRRSIWAAEEFFIRLNMGNEAEWRRDTGGLWPRNAEGAARWLSAHPEGSVAAPYRVNALITAGRLNEARVVAASMPEGIASELHLKLDVKMAFDLLDGVEADETAAAADAAARADAGAEGKLLAAHLARHASVVAQSHGRDGLAELAEARSAMGPLTGRWARRVWKVRLRFAIASFLAGAWILVAIALSGAASGGVFWL